MENIKKKSEITYYINDDFNELYDHQPLKLSIENNRIAHPPPPFPSANGGTIATSPTQSEKTKCPQPTGGW
jgi:hypothetical protein